jgi:hypothetical protein
MLIGLLGEREDLKNDNIMVDDVTKDLAVKIQREIESIIKEQVR